MLNSLESALRITIKISENITISNWDMIEQQLVRREKYIQEALSYNIDLIPAEDQIEIQATIEKINDFSDLFLISAMKHKTTIYSKIKKVNISRKATKAYSII